MSIYDNERFRTELKVHLAQFEVYLQQKLKPRTIHRHLCVIGTLIDFLCFGCNVSNFQEIHRSIVCSRFRRWYCSKIGDFTESEVNTSVKKFFDFLVCEQKIAIGKDVLTGLNIKSGS
ncbi:MAG: hypothetical protein ACKO7R_12370 [Pseudanabaena sp.]